MYQNNATYIRNHRAYGRAVVAALPELIWSEFLQRETRWSTQQVNIASATANYPELTQREIADRVGCTQGAVSKTLAMMKRLGILAVSTTRGCRGSTVAWFRRGVRRMIPTPLRTFVSGNNRPETGMESFRGRGALLGDILAGMAPAGP